MWSYKLFRIGPGVLVLMAAFHLMGHLAGRAVVPSNGTEITLHDMMYNYKTDLAGTMRSAGDLYDGASLAVSVYAFTLGALGFVVPVQRKIATGFAFSLLVMLVISLVYWFAIPSFFLALATAMYGGSALLNR